MPGNSAAIIGPYEAFCAGADENTTINDVAAELATMIVNFHATLLAGPPSTGANITSGLVAAPIESALLSDLMALEARGSATPPLPPDFLSTATAITTGLMAIMINPAIPALPAIVPISGYLVSFSGLPITLAASIASAMIGPLPSATAAGLVAGLTTNAITVTGLYIGNMPGPSGLMPAPPIPWVGLI
mgnify:CR=1 FL=1|jgi:hypothetical protein